MPLQRAALHLAGAAQDRRRLPSRLPISQSPNRINGSRLAASAKSFSMPGRHFAEMRAIQAHAKGQAIEKHRLATERRRPRPARRLINIQGIVAVDLARRQTERLGVRNQRALLAHLGPGRRHLPAVVLADQNQRQMPRAGDMHGLVQVAGTQGPVAEERHADVAGAIGLVGQGHARPPWPNVRRSSSTPASLRAPAMTHDAAHRANRRRRKACAKTHEAVLRCRYPCRSSRRGYETTAAHRRPSLAPGKCRWRSPPAPCSERFAPSVSSHAPSAPALLRTLAWSASLNRAAIRCDWRDRC